MVSHGLVENLDSQLQEDFEVAVESLGFDDQGQLSLQTSKYFNDMTFRDQRRWLEVWDETASERLYPSRQQMPEQQIKLPKIELGLCKSRLSDAYSGRREGDPIRVYCAPFSMGTKHVLIRVARSEEPMRKELWEILLTLLLAMPAAVATASFAGFYLARRALAPVEEISARAITITAERLNERLPVANPHDELGRLAGVFNDMFDRLAKSFETIRRFTSDASHELRTPLTAMISVGEVARMREKDASSYGRTIDSMLEEARRMSQLVASLLTLSRADTGHFPVNRKLDDLGSLTQEVATALSLVASTRNQVITIDASGPVDANVDRVILRQAIFNLVENALKYSSESSEVLVRVYVESNCSVVAVSDQGEGIPAEHLPRIFDRFYRIDDARSRQTGGAGLGLSIVKWAVEVHGGRVAVESVQGKGSVFRIIITN